MEWEDAFRGTILCLALSIIVSIFLYAYSEKHHSGYYLNTVHGEFVIYNNWENAPDETAFRTYSEQEALDTLDRLNNVRN